MFRTLSATPWCCNLNSPSGNNLWNFYYLISSSVLWLCQVFQEDRLQFTLHFMEYKKCVRYYVKCLYSIPTKMHLQLLAIPVWLTNCRFPGRTHTMCRENSPADMLHKKGWNERKQKKTVSGPHVWFFPPLLNTAWLIVWDTWKSRGMAREPLFRAALLEKLAVSNPWRLAGPITQTSRQSLWLSQDHSEMISFVAHH